MRSTCGCGAVVAHNLAKVRVASSNLVIRSSRPGRKIGPLNYGGEPKRWIGREARQRPAKPYTRVRIPYPPPARSKPRVWAIGAAVARFPDTEEVTGSIPVSPTERNPRETWGFLRFRALFWAKDIRRGVSVGSRIGQTLGNLSVCDSFGLSASVQHIQMNSAKLKRRDGKARLEKGHAPPGAQTPDGRIHDQATWFLDS
jgi:hypothetical protein